MSNEAENIRAIYRLLFDLAIGRRILEPDSAAHPDAFDHVRQRVYALGETLRDLVLDSGMVPPYTGFEHIISYVFVLDADHRIADLNITAAERLGYAPEDLRQRMFEFVLTRESVLEWRKCVATEHDAEGLFLVIHLVLLAENGSKLPLHCTVCEALFKELIFVLSIEVDLVSPTHLPEGSEPLKKEVAVIEQVHDYILAHLDEALPSIDTLSSTWCIETYKLRQGFKLYYGKSMYQFYQEERLKKGYQLILTTRLQLKEIAYRCGFNAYINFYKAFKKTYGMAPSELLRP